MKDRRLAGFGARLTQIRRSRGMTQAELGVATGVSNRVIAYYEQDSAQPPGAILVDLAKALRVSTDQLLGLKAVTDKTSPKTARLMKRLRRIEMLPPSDQKAVLKILDGLLEARLGRFNGGGARERSRRRSAGEARPHV